MGWSWQAGSRQGRLRSARVGEFGNPCPTFNHQNPHVAELYVSTPTRMQSDHAFSISVPAGLPPSISLEKGKTTGIVYHIVVTAIIKPRAKTLFGGTSSTSFKAPTTLTQLAEVSIEKHELNSTWPIYRFQAENEKLHTAQGKLSMGLRRETVCLGAGDTLALNVDLQSERLAPVKITRLELVIRETIITREPVSSTAAAASSDAQSSRKVLSQSTDIVSTKTAANSLLYSNESTSHVLSAVIPSTHYRFTVQNAKHLEVKYTLRVRAVIEVPKEAKQMMKKADPARREEELPVRELIIDNVPVLVSPWGKKSGEWWRQKIGQTPGNLDRPATQQYGQATQQGPPPQQHHLPIQPLQPQSLQQGMPPQQQQQVAYPSPPSVLPTQSPRSPQIERPAAWAALPIPAHPPSLEQQAQLDRERAAARTRERPHSMAVPPSALSGGEALASASSAKGGQAMQTESALPRPRRSSLEGGPPKLHVPDQLLMPAPLSPSASSGSIAKIGPSAGAGTMEGGSPRISPPMDARKEQPTLPPALGSTLPYRQDHSQNANAMPMQGQEQRLSMQQQQQQPQARAAFVPASAPPVPVHLDNRRLSTLQRTNPRSIPYSSTQPPRPADAASTSSDNLNLGLVAGTPMSRTANTSREAAVGDTYTHSRRTSLAGGPGTIPAAVFTGRHLSSFRPYSPQFMLLKQQQDEALRAQQGQQSSPNLATAIQTNPLASQSTSALPQSTAAFPAASELKLHAPQAQHAHAARPPVLRHRTASQSEPDLPSLGRALSQPGSNTTSTSRDMNGSANPIASLSTFGPSSGLGKSPLGSAAPHRYSRSDSGHGLSPSSSFGNGMSNNGYAAPYRANTSRAGVMSWHGQAAQMQSFRAHGHGGSSSPPIKMDGAYPAIPSRSPGASKRDSLGQIDFSRSVGPAASPRMYTADHERRSASDSTGAPDQSRLGGPGVRQEALAASTSPTSTTSSPPRSPVLAPVAIPPSPSRTQLAVSAVPMSPKRRSGRQSPPASPFDSSPAPSIALPLQKSVSEYGIAGYPTRKNTLSTIAASPLSSAPESPNELSSSGNGSLSTPLPQREWLSAEQEKERLYNEAKDRARATQEAAGNTIPGAAMDRSSSSSSPSISTEDEAGSPIMYKSVEGRAATPLSLMRTMSNPEPVRRNSRDLLSIDQALQPSPGEQQDRTHRKAGWPAQVSHIFGTRESRADCVCSHVADETIRITKQPCYISYGRATRFLSPDVQLHVGHRT